MEHTRALDVADDGTGGVVHKLDAHLGDATTRTWSSNIHQHWRTVTGQAVGLSVPVLPRTRVTLTSLTGVLEESIFATDRLCDGWENRSPGRDAKGCGVAKFHPDSIVRSQNRRVAGNFYFRSASAALGGLGAATSRKASCGAETWVNKRGKPLSAPLNDSAATFSHLWPVSNRQ